MRNIEIGRRELWSLEAALVGGVPKYLELSRDRTILRLHVDMQPPLYLVAAGRGSSKSWFEHITGISGFLGRRITALEDLYRPERGWIPAPSGGEQFTQSYAVRLRTAEGALAIDLRNVGDSFDGGIIQSYRELTPWEIEQAGGLEPLRADF